MNISLNDDVYFKIETTSEFLRNTIPHSPEWQHYKRDRVPPQLTDIAIWGPIIDTLLLFRNEGAYIQLLDIHGESRWAEDILARYTFQRSDEDTDHIGGTLATLLQRIGGGTVDIWIDPSTKTVRHIVITSDNYVSTTTLSNINTVSGIVSPASAMSY